MLRIAGESVRPFFLHKRKADGSIDSICPQCFQIIDSSNCDLDLKAAEDAHVCEGLDLNRMFRSNGRG
jgi:hypothetical protein